MHIGVIARLAANHWVSTTAARQAPSGTLLGQSYRSFNFLSRLLARPLDVLCLLAIWIRFFFFSFCFLSLA